MKPPPYGTWHVLWGREKIGLFLMQGDNVEDYAVRATLAHLDSHDAGIILDELAVDICDRVVQRDELRKALPHANVQLVGATP
jgi:hypothetical protein